MCAQVPEVKVTAQALLPSTSVIGFTLGNGLSFTTFVNTVPINEHRTVNRFALIRCCSGLTSKRGVSTCLCLHRWTGVYRPAHERTMRGCCCSCRRLDTMGLGPIFNLSAWDSVARQAMIR